ncbi:MAG: hypothetical protein JWN78_180 [Bacteroidota bacterium]|nr:hypothetical protein [Bacteroidota bacterium]
MSIIKISGKPIEKLIEVVSNAIGTIYKPIAMRNEAKAKAYEIEILERAKANALAEGKEIELENHLKIQNRLLYRENQRQLNIDNVTKIAEEELINEDTVSEEPINKDWAIRFFNIVEDVSDIEMQILWGKILAGEIKKPKSYSLRTLEVLKNLSKEEAEIFNKIAPAIIQATSCLIYDPDEGQLLEDKFGIKYGELLKLTESGLISSPDAISYFLKAKNERASFSILLKNGKKGIHIKSIQDGVKYQFQVIPLTKAGEELSNLIITESNLDYINKICFDLWNTGVVIKYGDILYNSNNEAILENENEYKRNKDN